MALLLSDYTEAVAEPLRHKTWTRDEVAVLESTGLLDGQHYELVEGELIDKMGKKRPHLAGIRRAEAVLKAVFGESFVDRETPIDVAPGDNPRNEPEPDLIVQRRPSDEYSLSPRAAELRLVVEVADSTLTHDLTTKAALYARANIPEYWVVDLTHRRLIVFRQPAGGSYQLRWELGPGDRVSPLESPERSIDVASLLP